MTYEEKKLKAWKEEYKEDILWEDFKENYMYCERCGMWDDNPCICYAR